MLAEAKAGKLCQFCLVPDMSEYLCAFGASGGSEEIGQVSKQQHN